MCAVGVVLLCFALFNFCCCLLCFRRYCLLYFALFFGFGFFCLFGLGFFFRGGGGVFVSLLATFLAWVFCFLFSSGGFFLFFFFYQRTDYIIFGENISTFTILFMPSTKPGKVKSNQNYVDNFSRNRPKTDCALPHLCFFCFNLCFFCFNLCVCVCFFFCLFVCLFFVVFFVCLFVCFFFALTCVSFNFCFFCFNLCFFCFNLFLLL